MKIKAYLNLLLALSCLYLHGTVNASVVSITSISQITAGTTIDFEQGGTVNQNITAFGLTQTSGRETLTTLVPWVTGNVDAPISGYSMSGDGITLQTTSDPLYQVGLSVLGSGFIDYVAEMSAFDINGNLIGSITTPFSMPIFTTFPEWSAATNDAVIFIGLQTDIPIYSIAISAPLNPNVAWDNLTFSNLQPTVIPLPASYLLLGTGLAALAWMRRRSQLPRGG